MARTGFPEQGQGHCLAGVTHGDSWRFRLGLAERRIIRPQAGLQSGLRRIVHFRGCG